MSEPRPPEGLPRAATGEPPPIRVAGDTNVGKVRTQNEDTLVVDPPLGLYAVFDGMGGAMAGDVAAQMARDVVHGMVAQQRATAAPAVLLEAAILHACSVIHAAANAQRDRRGMGTTVVAALAIDARRLVIAHVGDSRAYLWRDGRLKQLTRDHTIVEELVDRGVLAAADAENHAYKNVLSRNLGALPTTKVDVAELVLEPGDRVLLCSDGLYGYAATESIQYVLGSGDAPADVARDLIELALRGGGGDNVSTIVIETPAAPAPSSTQIIRTSGSIAWWQRRARFLAVARERGLPSSPICRGLSADEAIDLVAASLHQAVFHDLEKSTGVNVWTFAQNLASGWFERGGEWAPLRALVDILALASRAVVDELRAADASLGFLLDIAVSRALVVAELALGGLLAERLRQLDDDLVHAHAAASLTLVPSSQTADLDTEDLIAPTESGVHPAIAAAAAAATIVPDTLANERITPEPPRAFSDRPTIPFVRPARGTAAAADELVATIDTVLTLATARVSPTTELVQPILAAIEMIAIDNNAAATVTLAARDLYGLRQPASRDSLGEVNRTVGELGIMPMFDAIEQARALTITAIGEVRAPASIRARVLHRLSVAHQRLVAALAAIVLEAAAPYQTKLAQAQATTAALRAEVAAAERRRAKLEKRFATIADPSMPWGARGSTDW